MLYCIHKHSRVFLIICLCISLRWIFLKIMIWGNSATTSLMPLRKLLLAVALQICHYWSQSSKLHFLYVACKITSTQAAIITSTLQEPKYKVIIEVPPAVQVPLGEAIIAAIWYTDCFDSMPFSTLRREQLAVLPYGISVSCSVTRYLSIDGEISNEFYHISHEALQLIPPNVSWYYCFYRLLQGVCDLHTY